MAVYKFRQHKGERRVSLQMGDPLQDVATFTLAEGATWRDAAKLAALMAQERRDALKPFRVEQVNPGGVGNGSR